MLRLRVPVSLALLALTFHPARSQESKPLSPSEAVFIHATALMIDNPSNADGIYDKAMKSAEAKKPGWESVDHPILKGLASMEKDPKLREQYRTRLKKLLGDDPEKNGAKLLAEIKERCSKENVARMNEELKKSDGKSIAAESCFFPICLLRPPCKKCPDDD
jgi:hypothetical protein